MEDLGARLEVWTELLEDAEDVTFFELPLGTVYWRFPAPPGQGEGADDGEAAKFARRWALIQGKQGPQGRG